MTDAKITVPALIYNGEVIRDRNEMLSLTDMWKAAGSPANREPFNWARKEGAAFIEAVRLAHNLTQKQVIETKQGRNGGTFAHWQAGLAYAKYLSHDLHMWCNEVVRDRMEADRNRVALPSNVLDQIERSFGILRMTIGKVTELGRAVERLEAQKAAPTFDYSGSITSDKVIELAGVERKDRVRGTSAMVTSALLDYCDGVGCFRTAADLNPARPWRFPLEKAREWLFGMNLGAEQIRNQIARQKARKVRKGRASGQSALQLVAPVTTEDRPSA